MKSSSPIVNSRIVNLVKKHRLEQLSLTEAHEQENWIEADPANRQTFIQLSTSFSPGTSFDNSPPRKPKISITQLFLTIGITLAAILAFAWNIVVAPKPSIEPAALNVSSKSFEAPGVKIDSQFVFKGATLKNVMGAISYHYNIPVVYRGNMPNGTYSAVISSTMPIREMVELLNLVGIHSQYDGKQIIVTK